MKYQKPLDIWKMSDKEIKNLQPGQWIYAGDQSNKGKFFGMKKSGTVVVAWMGNVKQQASYSEYMKMLSNYAKN